jgi:hypothetical protein
MFLLVYRRETVHVTACCYLHPPSANSQACLCPVFYTVDSITNNARTLKEVSAYILFFARLKHEEIIQAVMGRKQFADIIKKSSLAKKSDCLPMASTAGRHDNPNLDKSYLMIFLNVMLVIPGKCNKFWKICCKAVNRNIVPMHGLKGKLLNNLLEFYLDVFLSLFCFFENIQELA